MGFFAPAEVSRSKLRLAIAGPSKTGKTFSSLLIAESLIKYLGSVGQLEGNGLISLSDSEHQSARKHAGRFKFYDKDLSVFHPDNYIQHLEESERGKFSVHIFDSLSHEWSGRGGILDTHAKITDEQKNKDSWGAWRKITPLHSALVDRIIRSNQHVICTIRSKKKTYREGNEIKKLGYGPIQGKEIEYEFDVLGMMDSYRGPKGYTHRLRFEGSRCPALTGRSFENLANQPGEIEEIGKILGEWLTIGQSPQPKPTPILPDELGRRLWDLGGELDALMRLQGRQMDWQAVLSKRGVTRIEDLTEADAVEMIGNIERKLATMRLREQVAAPSGGTTPPSQSFVPQPQHDLSTLTESVNRATAAIEIGSGPPKPSPQNPPQLADTQAQLPLSSSLGGVATGGGGGNGPIEQMNEVVNGIVDNIKAAQPAERLPDPPWDDAASDTMPDATQGQGQGDGSKGKRRTRPKAEKGS